MNEPLSPQALAWLRQSVLADGSTYSRVLLHLLERVEALEQRPIPGTVELAAPAPEAAPVATDEALVQAYIDTSYRGFGPALRSCYDLGRQHGATQPLAPQPAPPATLNCHHGGNMSKPLSPAANAVDEAAHRAWVTDDAPRPIAAAALRAAANFGENLYDSQDGKIAVVRVADLQAWAAELEATNA